MDVEAKAKVTDFLRSYGATPVLVTVVRKTSGIGKSNVIVAVADQLLAVFSLKGVKRKMVQSWLNLRQITRKNDKIQLTWVHGKFEFDATNATVVQAIYEVIQRVLLESELLRCGFDMLVSTRIAPNAAGFVPRFREKARLTGKTLSTALQDELGEIVVYSRPFVCVSELPDIAPVLPLFVECLPLAPTICDVSFKCDQTCDAFDLLAKLAGEWNYLRRIEVNGVKTSSYPSFLLNWKNSGNRKLRCLSFENTGMGTAHIDLLAEMAVGVGLRCVEFHNAVSDEAISSFYSRFLNASVMENLKSLNLDRTKNLDLDFLVPRIGSVVMLSLEDCGIEISTAIDKISKFTQLNVLNLSKNECRGVIRSLPICLHTLYVDRVKWSDQTLSRFITFACAWKLRLSMAMAITSEAEWASVFSVFETIGAPSLISLNWSHNPLSEAMFQCLQGSPNLSEINLSACLRESATEPVGWFCKYLANQTTLKKLVIRGTKAHYLGRSIGPVLQAVWDARSHIVFLDVTDSLSGDYGISELKTLLVERRYALETLVFDGLAPTTGINMVDFLKDIAKLSIRISFPHNDLLSLCKAELITSGVLDEIKQMFVIKSESSGYFDKQFQIFRYYPQDRFPHFATDKMLAELVHSPDSEQKHALATRLRADTQAVKRLEPTDPLIPGQPSLAQSREQNNSQVGSLSQDRSDQPSKAVESHERILKEGTRRPASSQSTRTSKRVARKSFRRNSVKKKKVATNKNAAPRSKTPEPQDPIREEPSTKYTHKGRQKKAITREVNEPIVKKKEPVTPYKESPREAKEPKETITPNEAKRVTRATQRRPVAPKEPLKPSEPKERPRATSHKQESLTPHPEPEQQKKEPVTPLQALRRPRARTLRRQSLKRPINPAASTSPFPLRRSLRRASTGLVIEDVDEIFPKPFERPQTTPHTKPQKPKRTRTQSQRPRKTAPITQPHYSGPNWSFPIPLSYTMDDQRLSLAYRQYDTNNILKTLMDRDTDPVLKMPRK